MPSITSADKSIKWGHWEGKCEKDKQTARHGMWFVHYLWKLRDHYTLSYWNLQDA